MQITKEFLETEISELETEAQKAQYLFDSGSSHNPSVQDAHKQARSTRTGATT
jgi:hypothetical protein